MTLFTQEIAKEIFNLIKIGAQELSYQAMDIINQVIKYMLFTNIINLLFNLLPLLISYLFIKWLDYAIASDNLLLQKRVEDKNEDIEVLILGLKVLKALRKFVPVLSIGVVLMISKPDILNLGKLLVAPKLVLLEEAKKIIDGVNK